MVHDNENGTEQDATTSVAGTIHPPLSVEAGGVAKITKRLSPRDIMASDDTETRDVPVKKWGGIITLKAFTSADRDAYELDMKRDDNGDLKNKNVRAALVARMAINEDGSRLFTDADAEWLGRKNAAVMDYLYSICAEMNGMTKKDRDEIEGNSPAGRGDAA